MVDYLQQPLAALLQVGLNLGVLRPHALELLQLLLDLALHPRRTVAGLLVEVG